MIFQLLLIAFHLPSTAGFGNALFQKAPSAQQKAPTRTPDRVEIELPDFDELFNRVQQVSPLARVAIESANDVAGYTAGFDAIEENPNLKWKKVDSKKKKFGVHKVEKIDNFQGVGVPILRMRATLEGPCIGEGFANFIMNTEDRKKWDSQIDSVYEAYPILDLDTANIAMGFNYGDCSRLGIGHCVTKPNLGIDAREQLTICGINDFADGSCLIWGTEMESWHDHLLPPGKRVTRAKSHIFSTILVPTSENTIDVEYVLQLEIGGKIPNWMTTPIIVDNVKKLFRCAGDFYNNKDGKLDKFLAEKALQNDLEGPTLLSVPP
mmetsp:Transcript_39336/g.95197  ORF Transcript_39336/g.95197 Transcript_39336/m.95197 type:complete len:322 (+) Transcript_39336:74-1039(+)|eukprot:CAMPEP_0113624928 /NCGR_PEP_ID=MMETSP0017_2-20120614/12864_1 /TAXON_ID=2856 /ORGANISM="Cylindrotheca closterium" /LENGTH=321 /DNA_ID=CAMNT_0000535001 /DNA_START=62 /DNA_END=1027 /DNA_ORIENTATION=- /assembly_acc=CAM_ASM_000147